MSEQRTGKLTVAVAQVTSQLGTLEENADRHLALIHEARASDVQVMLFPELSLTGHGEKRGDLQYALDPEHAMVKALVKASGPIITTFGLVEEGPGAQFYNSAFTVGGGRILHIHRKLNLAFRDATFGQQQFAAGRYLENYTLARRWRSATLIGGDFWNPALVYLAAVKGATLLQVPISATGDAPGAHFDTMDGWSMATRYSASIHAMPLLIANRVGICDGHHYHGASRIVGPTGETLADAGADEGFTVAEIDYAAVREARFALPTARDNSLDLVLRELDRIKNVLGVPEAVRRN